MRRSTFLVALMTFIVGFGLFQLKYEVMKLENQRKQINREIKFAEEAISILNAEWSHLTNPERLQNLANKHLEIEPVSGKQLISLTQVIDGIERQEKVQRHDRFALDQLVSAIVNDELGIDKK